MPNTQEPRLPRAKLLVVAEWGKAGAEWEPQAHVQASRQVPTLYTWPEQHLRAEGFGCSLDFSYLRMRQGSVSGLFSLQAQG